MRTEIPITDIDDYGSIQKLAKEVAELAGCEVRFFVVEDDPQMARNEAGSSTAGGLPKVYFQPHAKSAINACHELLHIRCAYEGYPRHIFTFDPDVSGDELDSAYHLGITEITSMNEHLIIYPEMQTMGFDPYYDYKRMVRQDLLPNLDDLEEYEARGLNQTEHMKITMTVARLLLELEDLELKNDVIQKLSDYQDDVERGKRIARRLGDAGTTPQDCEQALVDALNIAGIPNKKYNITTEVN